tara:strand:- start:1517 stop:1702 length:186 start_codon:yes stop_codon:yes gene_type:complete
MAPAPLLPRLATLPGAGGGLLPSRSQGGSPTNMREIGEAGEMFGAGAQGDPMSTGDSRRRS